MKNDPITLRLASLSEHDRFLARAQMARAEAIVELFGSLTRVVRRAWSATRGAVASRAKAYADQRTRYWPHAQA